MSSWDGLPQTALANHAMFPSGFSSLFICYLAASDQKFKRKEGNEANHVINAMAVAVSNWAQWLREQLPRSLSIRTVMPAEAQAAAKVRVDVICNEKK